MKNGSPIMLRLLITPHNRRAKDGSLSTANGLAAVGELVVGGLARSKPVAIVADYYYFLQPLGCKAKGLAARLLTLLLVHLPTGERLLFAVDDSPTKRYGPQVQGAGVHYNPTPGPADQRFLYGHIWVTFSLVLRHPLWHTIALPLLGLMYVRARDIANIPAKYQWEFRTKLQLAAQQMLLLAGVAKAAGKTVWTVVDGAYAKRAFLKPLRAAGVIIVSRLRKDAALLEGSLGGRTTAGSQHLDEHRRVQFESVGAYLGGMLELEQTGGVDL